MLYWSVVFLVLAMVAAFFGFGGVATTAVGISKTLFYVAIIVFLVTVVLGVAGRGKTTRLP